MKGRSSDLSALMTCFVLCPYNFVLARHHPVYGLGVRLAVYGLAALPRAYAGFVPTTGSPRPAGASSRVDRSARPAQTACACTSVRAESFNRGHMLRARVAADQVILTFTNPASSRVSLIDSLVKWYKFAAAGLARAGQPEPAAGDVDVRVE